MCLRQIMMFQPVTFEIPYLNKTRTSVTSKQNIILLTKIIYDTVHSPSLSITFNNFVNCSEMF